MILPRLETAFALPGDDWEPQHAARGMHWPIATGGGMPGIFAIIFWGIAFAPSGGFSRKRVFYLKEHQGAVSHRWRSDALKAGGDPGHRPGGRRPIDFRQSS